VNGMEGIGKLLVATGIAFAIVGGLLWVAGRLGFESLPGTLRLGSEQWGCYLPIALVQQIGLLPAARLVFAPATARTRVVASSGRGLLGDEVHDIAGIPIVLE